MTDYAAALAQVRIALAQVVEMIGNLDEPASPESTRPRYGEAPVHLAGCHLTGVWGWDEFMHYLYLPVRIPGRDHGGQAATMAIPNRLAFMEHIVTYAMRDAMSVDPDRFADPYVYLTMRRGFATPGNPLNRPGWHCDDFGGHDLNYIWTDQFPTRVLLAPGGLSIPEDDNESMVAMASFADDATEDSTGHLSIEEMAAGALWRLSPYVIHDTPVIPEPGGMRSFFKISVSDHRYNLAGNSRNYDLDYDWEMHDRVAIRNRPGGQRDFWETGPGSKPMDPNAWRSNPRTWDAMRPVLRRGQCGNVWWTTHPEGDDGEEHVHVQGICTRSEHDGSVRHTDGSEEWGYFTPLSLSAPICSHGVPLMGYPK